MGGNLHIHDIVECSGCFSCVGQGIARFIRHVASFENSHAIAVAWVNNLAFGSLLLGYFRGLGRVAASWLRGRGCGGSLVGQGAGRLFLRHIERLLVLFVWKCLCVRKSACGCGLFRWWWWWCCGDGRSCLEGRAKGRFRNFRGGYI